MPASSVSDSLDVGWGRVPATVVVVIPLASATTERIKSNAAFSDPQLHSLVTIMLLLRDPVRKSLDLRLVVVIQAYHASRVG